MKLRRIEIVEDRTAASRCDQGFLRLSRLELRNVYEDGSSSAPYACDVVTRPGPDAVVAALYRLAPDGRVRVYLREAPRPPIYLRRYKSLQQPDPRPYDLLQEVVAGILEVEDGPGEAGLRCRASAEAREEAGFSCAAESFAAIGEGSFASPGTSDEKVFYTAGAVGDAVPVAPTGDGSVMEEVGELVEHELASAIEACRAGDIPDMKTEIALLRLADHLRYIPQLGCFADELPEPLRSRYRPLGIAQTTQRPRR
jgi:ADP-ribose pyrophosphatase